MALGDFRENNAVGALLPPLLCRGEAKKKARERRPATGLLLCDYGYAQQSASAEERG